MLKYLNRSLLGACLLAAAFACGGSPKKQSSEPAPVQPVHTANETGSEGQSLDPAQPSATEPSDEAGEDDAADDQESDVDAADGQNEDEAGDADDEGADESSDDDSGEDEDWDL